jgi:16S rRNA (cytosine1402-N4)-methyltransferase
MTSHHYPVLLAEVLQLFEGRQIKIFVDGTLGAGGHAEAILKAHPEIQQFIGIDQDTQALEIAKERLKSWGNKVSFIHGNFVEVIPTLNHEIDGILLDLGVSSMQLDRADRGFSFGKEGPLDMRMDRERSLTAEEVVNTWSAADLGRIFRDYGEERQWRTAAKTIYEARKEERITTTTQLARILSRVIHKKKGKKINPLTLIFQALRICVNSELEVIQEVLPACIDKLKTTGCLAVISFHSLEDRIVKKVFRHQADDKHDTSGFGGVFLDKDPTVVDLTRRPIIPSDDEIDKNLRSRSAKLRAVEKR